MATHKYIGKLFQRRTEPSATIVTQKVIEMYLFKLELQHIPLKNEQRKLPLVHIHQKKVKKDLPKTKGVTPLNVKSSPGPSGSKKKPKVTKQNASGKFHVCHTIWESRSNLKFRARNGHRKITWIECNKKGCEFWAHVQVYF